MNKINYIFVILFVLSLHQTTKCAELKGLNMLLNILNGNFIENQFYNTKSKENEDNPSISLTGTSDYGFLNFITRETNKLCYKNDMSLSIEEKNEIPIKKQIKIECIRNAGNGTLQIIDSLKEVLTVLSTHGNSTKRNQPGNCALILFYTTSCPGSAMVAPHFNAIARQFPDLRIAAVDSLKYHSLNTEFGIVGLPTIMLFHQGRPVIKFNDTALTVNNFIKFVDKHTGIKPVNANVYVTSDDFNGPLPNKVIRETDYCLYLSWSFILLCSSYYFTKSKLFGQIVEMIKRNWRESEARHEVIN